MPTYEYACDACEHAFEEFQSITAAPLKKCPSCGKAKLKRLIGTGGGLIFKGSGFYTTDYRSDAYKKSAEAAKSSESGKPADGKTSSDAGAKSEAKTETSNPAAAAESKASDTKPANSPTPPKSAKSSAKKT